MPQRLTFLSVLSSTLSFVLFLQNYQINACPSSVQNNQICAKVLQQGGGGVHLGLPGCQCIASPIKQEEMREDISLQFELDRTTNFKKRQNYVSFDIVNDLMYYYK